MKEPKLPKGFVEAFRHQCPINPLCPKASGKFCFSAREDVYRGRLYSGKEIYYDTIEDAIRECIKEIERILAQREKLKYKTIESSQPLTRIERIHAARTGKG